ncbi:MAG: phosphatase PAP2 family protein [Bacilli bacterium]|nr:phosphatase PAP2 family protein [Bacilli bacterium]
MKISVNAKNPIKLRDIIIAACIVVAILVLGGIFDYKLTSAVYVPGNESWFGIVGAALVELPVCLGLGFAGGSLIFCRYKGKKVWEVFSIVIGALAILVSYYFVYDTFNDISKDIIRMQEHASVIKILAVFFAFIMEGLFVGLAALGRFKWGFDQHDMFILGIAMIIIAAASAIVSNGMKFLWSRPRPRYIFTLDDPEAAFHPLWKLDPFKSITASIKDKSFKSNNLKSFPSGHTVYAGTAMFVLPYIACCSPKVRDDRRIMVALFYVGMLWCILAGLSRVYAGAHFLSDTAAGFGTTLLVGSLINYLLLFRKKKAPSEEPQA